MALQKKNRDRIQRVPKAAYPALLIIFILPFLVAVNAQPPAISFTDVSAASGINVPHVSTPEKRYIIESMSGGAAVFDCDRDGFLDVFVAGYVKIDLNDLPVFGSSQTCSYKGIRVQCGPRGLPGERDYLFHNRGDGSFEEVAVKAGVSDQTTRYFGLGV